MQGRRLTECNERKKQAAFWLANVEIHQAFDAEATLLLAELNSFNFPFGTLFCVCFRVEHHIRSHPFSFIKHARGYVTAIH